LFESISFWLAPNRPVAGAQPDDTQEEKFEDSDPNLSPFSAVYRVFWVLDPLPHLCDVQLAGRFAQASHVA
jgi:hypothetical protein